jgi:hypothetical protein
MGMFDSIFIKVKCPYCGEEKLRECQTKELDCELKRWDKGDNTDHPEESSVIAFVTCGSFICRTPYRLFGKTQLYNSKGFEIEIETPLGLITGKYKYI